MSALTPTPRLFGPRGHEHRPVGVGLPASRRGTFRPFRLQPPLATRGAWSAVAPRLTACRAEVDRHPRSSGTVRLGLRPSLASSPPLTAESSSSPTDQSFVSGCSPPRLATTQLPSTTKSRPNFGGNLHPTDPTRPPAHECGDLSPL